MKVARLCLFISFNFFFFPLDVKSETIIHSLFRKQFVIGQEEEVSCLSLGLKGYSHSGFLFRRIRGADAISPEQRRDYENILRRSNLAISEENIRLLHSVNESAERAGFSASFMLRFGFPKLAKLGLLTEDTLSQLTEFARISYDAGFDADFLFMETLPKLTEQKVLTPDNLIYLLELARISYRRDRDADDLFTRGFPVLADKGILKRDNLAQIVELAKAGYSARFSPIDLLRFGFPALKKAGVLSEDNLGQIINFAKSVYALNSNPTLLFKETLPSLARSGLLTGATLDKIIEFSKIMLPLVNRLDEFLEEGLLELAREGVVRADNLDLIIQLGRIILSYEVAPYDFFVNALTELAGGEILRESTLPDILELTEMSLSSGHNVTELFRVSLPVLKIAGILRDENWDEIKSFVRESYELGISPNKILGYALPAFKEAGLLNDDNLAEFGQLLLEVASQALSFDLPSDDIFTFTFPALIKRGILKKENLLQLGNQLIEASRPALERGVSPEELFGASIPELIEEQLLNEENFSVFLETAKDIYLANADASWVLNSRILSLLQERGFQLDQILKGGSLYQQFLNFFKWSGRYLKNNVKFFEEITPQNIHSEMETLKKYFNERSGDYHMFPLYLKSLYQEYKQLDNNARKELIREFLIYYQNQTRGIVSAGTSLSPEIIEETNFAIVGSTNLTLDVYRRVMEEFKDEEIPPANFNNNFTLDLNLSIVHGELSNIDLSLLSSHLGKLERSIERPAADFLSEQIGEFFSKFLVNKELANGELRRMVELLSQDSVIQEGIEAKDAEMIKRRVKELLREMEYNEGLAISELFELAHIRGERNLPPGAMVLEKEDYIALGLKNLYLNSPALKAKIDNLLRFDLESSLDAKESLSLINSLIEVYLEINPTASEEIREVLDTATGLSQLNNLRRKFHTEKGDTVERVTILPSKTPIDYFYGYFGENCCSAFPGELLNEHFTPLRIVSEKGIEGAIHTLTYEIDGKKSLLIVGIEPRESLVFRMDGRVFVRELLDKIISQIARANGYQQVLIATNPTAQSNRPTIQKAIQELIADKPVIEQFAQEDFPEYSDYEITEMAVYWP